MKKFIIALTCIFFSITLTAQNLQYLTGAKIENFDKISFDLFRQDENKLYAYSYIKPHFYIDIFDKEKLNAEAHIKVPLPPKDSINFSFEELLVLKDKFLAFYSYFNKSEKQEKLEMIVFDKNGQAIGERKLIDTLAGKNDRRAGAFSIFHRPNENTFVSYGVKKIKQNTYIEIDHFDYDGNKIKSEDFIVDNSMGVVLSTLHNNHIIRLLKGNTGKWNLQWHVNIYAPNTTDAKVIKLIKPQAENIFVSDMFRSYIDDKNILHLLSPYITSMFSEKAKGLYYAEINLDSYTLVKESIIPFKIGANENIEDADFSLSSCVLTNLQPLKNGMRAIFESRLLTLSYGIPTQYKVGNIISFDIDSNNVARDIKVIKKKQNMAPSIVMYSSFTTLVRGDTTFCIYNELPDNLKENGNRIKNINGNRIDETVVVYASIDNDALSKTILIDKANNEINTIMPSSAMKDSFKAGVLYVLRRVNTDVFLTKIF